jgi:hypothetical protein
VAVEVAQCPLAECFLAFGAPRVGHPLVEEHDLLLTVSYRSVAEGSGLREMSDEVEAALFHREEAGFLPDG